MSVAEQIIHKLQQLPESGMQKILEYIEFLEYQQQKNSDPGLQIAIERSEAFAEGKTSPLSKKEFWEQLQQKLG